MGTVVTNAFVTTSRTVTVAFYTNAATVMISQKKRPP
jgi:hypothetical protein